LRRSDGVFPWWRVVSASGRLLAGHEQMQTELLVAEGIEVRDGRIRG
jgi:alkylated DNA nucleotide flippase Atl1